MYADSAVVYYFYRYILMNISLLLRDWVYYFYIINPITVIENHLHVNHGPTLHYRWSSHSRGEISYKIQLNVATAYNVLFHYWQHPRITLRSVFKLTVVKPRTWSHTRINQNPTHSLIPVVTHNWWYNSLSNWSLRSFWIWPLSFVPEVLNEIFIWFMLTSWYDSKPHDNFLHDNELLEEVGLLASLSDTASLLATT